MEDEPWEQAMWPSSADTALVKTARWHCHAVSSPTDVVWPEESTMEGRMSRPRWTRLFLWMAVLGWGIGLGAKLFDLRVLASAWGRSAPGSLALYPYGKNWPVNPGTFFQPFSAPMVIGIVEALISGWQRPPRQDVL